MHEFLFRSRVDVLSRVLCMCVCVFLVCFFNEPTWSDSNIDWLIDWHMKRKTKQANVHPFSYTVTMNSFTIILFPRLILTDDCMRVSRNQFSLPLLCITWLMCVASKRRKKSLTRTMMLPRGLKALAQRSSRQFLESVGPTSTVSRLALPQTSGARLDLGFKPFSPFRFRWTF